MIHIYKANMQKLSKNFFYIIGCIIALSVTFLFSANTVAFEPIAKQAASSRMYFVSAAMVLFFSVFTPAFICPEFKDGIIRNRILSGYSRKDDYFAAILTIVSAVLIMSLCYLIGGFLGIALSGEAFLPRFILPGLIMIIAITGYAVLVGSLSYRIGNIVVAAITGMFLFFLSYNFVLFGNLFLMLTEGKPVFTIMNALYNTNVLGQWFMNTDFTDNSIHPGYTLQMIMPFVVMALALLIGTAGLEKRELK